MNQEKNKMDKTVEITKRELEVLEFLADGMTTDDIAREMFLSPATVDTHRRNIIKKLDVNNITEAVAHGLRTGLIK